MGDEDDVPDRITREVVLPTSGTQELPRAARAPPSKVPASVGQGARLVVLSGADAGRKYLLQTRAVIGRAGGLEIQLRDSLVSRVHAEIARAPAGQFTIHDRGSRHGTRLNGRVVTASPTPLAFGDRIQIGGTDLVFTYRDPAEEALEEHEQLETLGRLGAALVHDMNNLLGVSLACADEIEALVRASEDPAEARSLVLACTADIVRATVRGRDLNEQLLRLARRQPARTEEIDFSALVNEAIDLARRTFHHGIRVEREVAGGVRVVGDRSELHRALLNLMLNARDAMPSGGEFAVELRLGSDSLDPQSQSPERVVRVTVRDSGHGMDEETRARIFQPLFTTKRTGTGLGLPTVARIIAEHGGRIHCESAPRKGTSFEIVLPRASSDAALASPTSRPPMER